MSNYLSGAACELLLELLGPELYYTVVALVDEEIEALCNGCERVDLDSYEPAYRHNEGYL